MPLRHLLVRTILVNRTQRVRKDSLSFGVNDLVDDGLTIDQKIEDKGFIDLNGDRIQTILNHLSGQTDGRSGSNHLFDV